MREARQAIRVFAKSPGFTAVLLLTLALGIGANTAVFSVIDGVLLRPLPYRDPARLINILDASLREAQLAKIFASYTDFEEYAGHAHTLERIGATSWAGRTGAILTGRGSARSYLTLPVTSGFFDTLGVAPALGRTFTDADRSGDCALVVSERFWRAALHADPAAVGRPVTLDDRPCTVLGVMPAAFAFYPPETQIWSLVLADDQRLKRYFGVFVVARLKPGATIKQARDELTSLHSALQANATNGENKFAPLVSGLQDQFQWLAGRNLPTTLGLLFGAVLAVLAIACLNVTNLLVMRNFAREREFAIRAAIGSGRGRLVRQLLTESMLVTAAGGALGLLVAFGMVRVFNAVQPIELPVGASVSINLPALLFAVVVSAIALLFFGVVPAWAASKVSIYNGLRASGQNALPGGQRLSRMLVAAEMALSVVLLSGASLLMRSVLNFGSAPLGFAVKNVTVASGTLPEHHFPDNARKLAFFDTLRERLGNERAIRSATIASSLPPYGLGLTTLEIQGKPVPEDQRLHDVGRASVDREYFHVMEVPLRRGRVFDARDQAASARVAIVNEALVREYFEQDNPLGRQIRLADDNVWATIVGVVGNELTTDVLREMSWITRPAVYMPVAQNPPSYFSVAVRAATREVGIGHALEETVASVDPQVATGHAETMQSRLAPYLKYPEFRAAVVAAFASLAILLAAVGLYGVLAQFVTQRTREIGIRMAVGADARRIASLVASKGGVPFLAGLSIGAVASAGLTRYLSSLLFGVTATDPGAFGLTLAVMVCAAVVATIFPARRAVRVDPVDAMRSE
jgi:putative ABC transport system permease protein